MTIVALGAGCTGTIHQTIGSGGSGVDPGSPSGAGSNPGNPPATPAIAAMANEYFPGTADVAPPKRLVRLSRTQLDLTAKALLPTLTLASARTSLPSDPLQTNYEYADNLSFNPANFTPFASWVDAIAASVKAAPPVGHRLRGQRERNCVPG